MPFILNKMYHYKCIAVFSVLLVFGLSSCSVIQEEVIIIDAGSTGSRIKIYSTNKTSSRDIMPAYVLVSKGYKLPALSQLSKIPGSVVTDFCDVIVREAQKHVKNARKTRIYIMATAGMRGIPEDVIMMTINIIRQYFGDPSKSQFMFSPKNCRVLSGEEEGAFAWIAINYINKAFQNPATKRVGILEMGGASIQVAFESKKSILAHQFPVKIAGKWYRLYSNSYYAIGLTFLKKEIQIKTKQSTSNPCDLRGENEIRGESTFSNCMKLVNSSIILKYNRCILKPCAIRSVYQPSIDRDSPEFHALGIFRVILNSFRKTFTMDELISANVYRSPVGRVTLLQIRHITKIYCNKDLESVLKKGVSRKYASSNCFVAVYLINILKNLGFKEFNIIHGFELTNKETSTLKPEWTLGAIIYERHKLDSCYGGSIRGVKSASENVILSHCLVYLMLLILFFFKTE